ncbi:MAG: hypothetical protein E7544_09090 [Ruminococcaceae bacterium]|nr:hypothetical protein [Oscillospiraceae bacterium]
MTFKKIYVCSPLRAETKLQHDMNMFLAREYEKIAAEHFSCRAVAPHGYVSYILDEDIPEERQLGLSFSKSVLDTCDALAIFGDYISEGMYNEIMHAFEKNLPVYKYDGRDFCRVCDIECVIRIKAYKRR